MDMNASTSSRATSLEELGAILQKVFTEESFQRGLAFHPRPSDVIISPFSKSGTTWLQHIAHGLRTRGSMDFDEITEVTPWIEAAYNFGWDLEAEQVAEPCVFKSHLSWHHVPKGCRYICSFRHPYDVILSLYRFFEGWLFEPGSFSLEAFARWRWPRAEAEQRGYWYHLISWWEQRDNPDVLLLCYEEMKEDLPGRIRRVARHMGVELDDELFDMVVRQSSREFMLANRHHFDEKITKRFFELRAGVPPGGIATKVTPGPGNETRYQLPAALKEELDDIWQEQVEARFGFKDYGELRQAVRRLSS